MLFSSSFNQNMHFASGTTLSCFAYHSIKKQPLYVSIRPKYYEFISVFFGCCWVFCCFFFGRVKKRTVMLRAVYIHSSKQMAVIGWPARARKVYYSTTILSASLPPPPPPTHTHTPPDHHLGFGFPCLVLPMWDGDTSLCGLQACTLDAAITKNVLQQ